MPAMDRKERNRPGIAPPIAKEFHFLNDVCHRFLRDRHLGETVAWAIGIAPFLLFRLDYQMWLLRTSLTRGLRGDFHELSILPDPSRCRP
jgi:hypothetical protein